MPQFDQHKKGQSRIRVLSKDATRAYLMLMQRTGGKMQALPGDVFVLDEELLPFLQEKGIEYEVIKGK